MGMKVKLAVAAAALMGALAISATSQAAPLAGTGHATQTAKVDAMATEHVRYRRYGHRGYGYRRYGYRRYGYRRYGYGYPYYQPYYGGYGYGYPYRYYRRPRIYFGFGF
jgi:hypothetical protein